MMGEYKVSERMRQLWQDVGTRDEVKTAFAKCGWNADRGSSRLQAGTCMHILYNVDPS